MFYEARVGFLDVKLISVVAYYYISFIEELPKFGNKFSVILPVPLVEGIVGESFDDSLPV